MTRSEHKPVICTSGDPKDSALGSLKSKAELEKLDIQEGHEYVPMDVYIDLPEEEEHFRASSILSRRGGIH